MPFPACPSRHTSVQLASLLAYLCRCHRAGRMFCALIHVNNSFIEIPIYNCCSIDDTELFNVKFIVNNRDFRLRRRDNRSTSKTFCLMFELLMNAFDCYSIYRLNFFEREISNAFTRYIFDWSSLQATWLGKLVCDALQVI